ncbi:MAG: ribosome maturation factor RimM [Treponema sp.]|jgi:16S rRNA processing protein RimM|nr:ribosome maturation factor RimM [Treponema sp.]
MKEKFIIGLVGAPFGIKGFVKIRSLSGEIDHLLELESVIVSKDGVEQLLKIEEASPSPPSIRFAGFDNPEKAKTLSGAQLLGGRDQAAPLDEGEFYIEDLKGLPVLTENGEEIGIVCDVIEGGGGDLVEIKLTDGVELDNVPVGQKGEKKLIPFRKEFFPEICPKKGKLVLKNLWILE